MSEKETDESFSDRFMLAPFEMQVLQKLDPKDIWKTEKNNGDAFEGSNGCFWTLDCEKKMRKEFLRLLSPIPSSWLQPFQQQSDEEMS